jgi:threonine/homoserine/homoserine lactone efflux protein
MTPERLAALAVFAFVSAITPGPNNLMLLASGLNYGVRRTLPHLLGVFLGFILLLVSVGFGLSAVLALIPGAETVIKILCLVYLLYLAHRMAMAGPVASRDGNGESRPMRWYEAVAFQWVNPKGWAMALTAFATYTQDSVIARAFKIVGAFAFVGLPCSVAWILFGLGLRQVLSDPVRVKWFNGAMAILLIVSVVPFLR